MSRIGKNPIQLSSSVKIDITDKANIYGGQTVVVKGPKGELSVELRPEVEVNVEGDVLSVSLAKKSQHRKNYWGLYRSLVNNAVVGVVDGYVKELEIVGIGYKAEKIATGISLTIGLNHPVIFNLPAGVSAEITDSVFVKLSGIDKELVGETAARLRGLKKPEPYKGKGIKYKGEQIRRKAGKAAA